MSDEVRDNVQDSGLRPRKKLAAKTDQITTTSQSQQLQQVEEVSRQLKAKSIAIELAIPSNSQTENIDKVTATASPSEILETLEAAASPLIMASPPGEANDDPESAGHSPTRKRPVKIKFLSVIKFSLSVCITLLLILSVIMNKLKGIEFLSVRLWRWCGVGFSIFCGRLILERWMKNSRKIRLIQCWIHLISFTWFYLISFICPFRTISCINPYDKAVVSYFTNGFVFTTLVIGLWIERADIIESLYASFYKARFSERFNQDRVHQYILQTLSEPPVIDPQRIICNMIETASQDGFHAIPNTLDESRYLMTPDEQNNRIITAEREAKAAGDLIFINVAKPGYKYIEEEDLLRFMNKDDVDMVLPLIGRKDESGRISEKSFLKWVVSMYMKSKFLVHSIIDIEEAMMTLYKYVNALVILVLVNLWVTAMSVGIVTIKGWIILQLCQFFLAVLTIFGCSLKSIYDGMIFVFKKHPFDVGDHCVIDGVQVFVEKVSILSTVVMGQYNQKMNLPNSTLDTKSIINFNRSPQMRDTVEFDVDFSASAVNVSALKAKIKTYIDSNPYLWKPEHSVLVREVEDVNKMKMILYVTHTINFQDYEEIRDRRSDLVLELGNIFHQLRIKYHIHPPKSCD